ncbi:hypothetical protein GFS31_16330 [Leptolyngbya sp. BL0902]|nr:hypothetical protein GFS31_16330 [Leptolyngbya sp. BL0902]
MRQHNWSPEAAINVSFSQLFVPGPPSVVPAAVAGGSALALPPLVPVAAPRPGTHQRPQPSNVIDMVAYRLRKGR